MNRQKWTSLLWTSIQFRSTCPSYVMKAVASLVFSHTKHKNISKLIYQSFSKQTISETCSLCFHPPFPFLQHCEKNFWRWRGVKTDSQSCQPNLNWIFILIYNSFKNIKWLLVAHWCLDRSKNLRRKWINLFYWSILLILNQWKQ